MYIWIFYVRYKIIMIIYFVLLFFEINAKVFDLTGSDHRTRKLWYRTWTLTIERQQAENIWVSVDP